MKNDVIPVVIFAYSRVDLLRRLLESLKNDEVPLLYFFSDGARNDFDKVKVEEVRKAINEVNWCNKVVFEHETNLGLGKSVLFGVTEVLSKHNAAIIFEDDLICVKGTYRYLTLGLVNYQNIDKVMSVTGWTHPQITPSNLGNLPYFDGKAECWCWGTWARAWKGMEMTTIEIYNKCFEKGIDIEKYGSDMPKMALEATEKNLWAIRWWYLHMLRGGLCLRPPHSLVETTGWDGRGTTITPAMMEWENPPLKNCPPVPSEYPKPIENEDCKILWRKAIDKGISNYTKLLKYEDEIKKIKHGIWMIPKLLTNTECEYLLLKAKEHSFKKANDSEKYGRYNKEVFIKNDDALYLIRTRFIAKFCKEHTTYFLLNNTTEILEFYNYQKGDYIKPHSDAPTQIAEMVFTNYTLVIYLNDGFEGGETFFSVEELKVKAEKGGAILFDQSLSHGGSEVLHGEKYILRLGVFVENLNN